MKMFILLQFIFLCVHVAAGQEMPLYGYQPIPNSKPVPDQEKLDSFYNPFRYVITKVSHPTLTLYKPKLNRSGTAIIICPGGAYYKLSMTGEGSDVAKWLNSIGITAFVLKYRLPNDETMFDKTIGPLQDAQRAIQIVRQHAADWAIDTNKIGILGFSAGGHLASAAGTHFLESTVPNTEHISLRPDFMILIYPLISLYDSITHLDSRDFLLGIRPDSSAILAWSNENHVTQLTPPAFIVQAQNDPGVPVWNSLYFYEALVKNKVPAELHIYSLGGHGFGLHNTSTSDEWTDRLKNWLNSNGWLESKKSSVGLKPVKDLIAP